MKTGLDTYFETNRGKLDVELPDDEHIWREISKNMDRSENGKRWFLRIAAAVLLLLSVGVAGIVFVLKYPSPKPHEFTLADVSKPLADKENVYRFVLQEKMKQVNVSSIDPASYQRMISELGHLDMQYERYLEDLNTLGDQPRIIQGLIRCYELKIKIMERTLCEINKTERYENKRNVL